MELKLTKKQKVLIGLLIVGVLLYLIFFRRFKNTTNKNVSGDVKKQKDEQSYIGAQDCLEICERNYQRGLKHCFDKYNGQEGTKECLSIVETNKAKCTKGCVGSYPTSENFNADVRDNFNAILDRDAKIVGKDGSRALPSYYDLRLKIDVSGKKSVFPFTIKKATKGAMELPNRRSLLNQDIKYRYIDVNQNDTLKIVALINLSYTVDHFAFNDDFLLTDKDYVISYSQAVQHFELV